MSLIPATGNLAGQIEPISGEEYEHNQNNADNTVAFVRGNVLVWKNGTIKKCTSGDTGQFAVCMRDKAQTATLVTLYDKPGGFVTVVADGAIKPKAWVKPSTATDGQVQQFNPSSGTSNDVSDECIGVYWKRAQYVGEGDGVTATADAADGDIILIRLK
jgi:hypothetical protein